MKPARKFSRTQLSPQTTVLKAVVYPVQSWSFFISITFDYYMPFSTLWYTTRLIGADLGGARASAFPIIEKCPRIFNFLTHFAPIFWFARPIYLTNLCQ